MLVLATIKFDGKFDKGGLPYIMHCLTVMHKLRTKDQELMAMAAGHDLIEDTDVTYDVLRNEFKFSERIIAGIRAMTRLPGQTDQEYLDQIKANPDAIRVKLADLQHNSDIRRLKGITEKDLKRMQKYHWMYMELKDLV